MTPRSILNARRGCHARLVAAVLSIPNLLAPGAPAQRFSLGVVVGGYGNRDFVSQYSAQPGSLPLLRQSGAGGYLAGPSVDVRMFARLSLGVEALYKPLHYRDAASFGNGAVTGFAPATVVTWQFPVLARYRFPLGRLHPFLEVGPSFRSAGNRNAANPSHSGVSAGAGVETGWQRLRIAPRVRYTRWAEDTRCGACTRPDQLEFLAGVRYVPASGAYPLGRRISLGFVMGANLRDESTAYTGSAADPFTGALIAIRGSRGPRRLQVGPLVELTLSPRFSIEGNALVRSHGISQSVTMESGRALTWSGSFGLPWEFPALLKYRLSGGGWRPFVGMGPAFRLPGRGASWNYGAAGALGVEVRTRWIRISPSLRFTHWAADRSRTSGHSVPSLQPRNRADLLAAVSF